MADEQEPKKEAVRIALPPRLGPRPSAPELRESARINLPARPPLNSPPDGSTGGSNFPAAAMKPPSPPLPPPATRPAGVPSAARQPSFAPPSAHPPQTIGNPAARARPIAPPRVPTTVVPPPLPAKSPAPAAPIPPNLPPRPVSSAMAAAPPPTPASSGIYPGASSSTPPSPGPKQETARISLVPKPGAVPAPPTVWMTKTQPLKTAPSAVITPAASPTPVNGTSPRGSDALETIPPALCWGLFGVSAVTFLIQVWNYFGV